jgi:hypothetical protein
MTVYTIVPKATFLCRDYAWVLKENYTGSNANEVSPSSTGQYKAIITTKCMELKDCHINLPQLMYRMQTNGYEGLL